MGHFIFRKATSESRVAVVDADTMGAEVGFVGEEPAAFGTIEFHHGS